MNGILVCNHFLNTDKFTKLNEHLVNSAKMCGISLEVMTNSEVICSKGLKTDFVLFWDKDVNLARLLEKKCFRVFNSAKSIELCDDKAKTYIELLGEVKQPETLFAPKSFFKSDYKEFLDFAVRKLSLPIVFKECFGSFGEQVYLCRNRAEIESHISEKPFLLQKFIASSQGKDCRIEVIGKKAVCKMVRTNENDFRANVTNGGSAACSEITEYEKETAEKCAEVLGLDFCGVDILTDGSVCEVNSNAHILNLYNATGIDCGKLIFEYIKKELAQ